MWFLLYITLRSVDDRNICPDQHMLSALAEAHSG